MTRKKIYPQLGVPHKLIGNVKNISVKTLNKKENKWLDNIVQVASSVEEQILLVVFAVEANKKFYKDAERFCESVSYFLRKKVTTPINVRLFGSAGTHLALKDSDVDIYLDFHDQSDPEEILSELFITRKMECNLFQEIELIEASVPIFKGVTISGLPCDISYTSPFAIYSSELINFFISVDDRIRQLITLLKFFLKKQNLYGGDSKNLKSHAIVLLVIFYLQQGKSPALPPLYSLQKMVSTKEIDGWVVSFAKISEQISVDKLPLSNLLKNFFAYYANFDFETKVVSPFLGKVIPKADFNNLKSLPREFECLKKKLAKDPDFLTEFDNKVMCVQDFITHNGNVTKDVREKIMKKFKQACEKAYNLFQQEETKHDSKNSVLLYELLKPSEEHVTIVQTSIYFLQNNPLEKTLKILQIFVDEGSALDSILINEFFTFLESFLRRVMKCEVVVHDDENKIKTYRCTTDHRIVPNKNYRKRVLEKYRFKNKETIIAMGEKISKSYLNQKLKSENISAFDIKCIVKNNPSRMECHFVCKEKKGRRAFISDYFGGLLSFIMRSYRIAL